MLENANVAFIGICCDPDFSEQSVVVQLIQDRAIGGGGR